MRKGDVELQFNNLYHKYVKRENNVQHFQQLVIHPSPIMEGGNRVKKGGKKAKFGGSTWKGILKKKPLGLINARNMTTSITKRQESWARH